MKISQEIVKKAGIIQRLSLCEQIIDEGGNKKGVRGTGIHRVKLLEDKVVMGKDFMTGQERYEMKYILEENGEKKFYSVPLKDKNGEVHYLVQRLSEIKEGEEIILEYQRKGLKGYIAIRSNSMENEPEQPTRAVLEATDDIKDDIPVVEEREPTKEQLDEIFDN